MMGGKDSLYYPRDGAPGPDDLGLAWDAAERYAVRLLREALPEARAVPVPAGELSAEAARFRSAARKWPYRSWPARRGASGRASGHRLTTRTCGWMPPVP
jgi:hypothetical protein